MGKNYLKELYYHFNVKMYKIQYLKFLMHRDTLMGEILFIIKSLKIYEINSQIYTYKLFFSYFSGKLLQNTSYE